ncbi:hypothetical protein APHAL10511_007472 [Amanita phalloides]|nr:hypothetical protein APHAL10511_007472 [Amanita phalloides]
MNTVTDNISGVDPYPLLLRPIHRTYTDLRRPKQDTNHTYGFVDLGDGGASPGCWRHATNPPHGQVSMHAFADDPKHHSFNWTPVTFASSGSTSMLFKTLVTGSSKDSSCPWSTLPAPWLDVPDPTASSSLHQLLAEATLDEIPTASHTNAKHSPSSSCRSPSTPAHELKLDPFQSSTIMFPSLSTVLNGRLDNRASPQIELDALGHLHLPTSKYVLTLESECNFHYDFWDGYNKAQFYFLVDIALHLDPTHMPLYECIDYMLALPSVPRIAVCLASLVLPMQFMRLLPKPHPSVSETDNDMLEEGDPNDPGVHYTYTTSYHSCIIRPLEQQQNAAAGKEDKPDSGKGDKPDATRKRDKGGATGKRDKPDAAGKKDKLEQITPVNGIHLTPNWKRAKPLGSPSVPSPNPEEDREEEDLNKTEPEETHAIALDRDNERHGFVLRAWIPVPLSLFELKEMCMFRVNTRVWIKDPYTYTCGGNGRTQML